MDEFLEPHVRRVVAEHLGVGLEELVAEVSLRDDLAADSLDLAELALALEDEFAIVLPERILGKVRTFSDLVDVTGALLRASSEAEGQFAWRAGHGVHVTVRRNGSPATPPPDEPMRAASASY